MRKGTLAAAFGLAIGLLMPVASAHAAPADTAAKDGVGVLASWWSGTLNPGASSNWYWYTGTDRAYMVGLSPQGASTTAHCDFEVTRTWYEQLSTGDRQFRWTIKNVGTIACGAEVYLTSLIKTRDLAPTGGLNPGETLTRHWNNANPLTASHLLGLYPNGATSTAPCKMEVVRTWYTEQPDGEREFWYTYQNVGTIACTADVVMVERASTNMLSTGAVAAGSTYTNYRNNMTPLNNVHFVGLTPQAAGATPCSFEVLRTWYRQRLNPAAEREFHYTLKNIGSSSCSTGVLLATVAA